MRTVAEISTVCHRQVSDGAICLADSFEFTIYHCTRLKSFRHD